ncbi:hypothetical protein M0R88_12690 [Halorussus gelatinilyticus]|uniref:Uncharacterized protein n=1 Tax=Halorussus gelatinilyticus TaxID=2937524 RepID=A0A8U0IE85_9EURY|nr:hypothetical protein [Halorussus gelatinilyticus]UPV99379.1 hypothetical protein M0R88_12690 [Halorussus gelatinilyticus]
MTRNAAVDEAAVSGLAGAVLLAGGSFVASSIYDALGPWLGIVPALLVWGVGVYYAMKQFANGIYTVVADASGP